MPFPDLSARASLRSLRRPSSGPNPPIVPLRITTSNTSQYDDPAWHSDDAHNRHDTYTLATTEPTSFPSPPRRSRPTSVYSPNPLAALRRSPAAFPALPPGVLAADSPSFISSRSANSLISFSRPTRIQAVTLHFLNRLLDELLLLILASARSLSTDRIKSDGILRVLGSTGSGALLAKNAVLEAELEMRSYVDGMRKDGNRVPLGLSATSRLDGTDNFPVKSAYDAVSWLCWV